MAAPTPSPAIDQSQQKLFDGPARPPPAGVVSNFDNPQNLETSFRVTIGLALGFATVAVIIRIYTKHILLRTMGFEDCKQ